MLSFVLPDDWLTAGDALLASWMRDHRAAMVALLVSVVVVVVPMLTFPLKEKLSAHLERDLRRPGWRAPSEPPLWFQAWEELLLLVVFAALALGALRVSLTPGAEHVGRWLTHGVLTFTFAVDFIGPTLTRRRITPTGVYARLARRAPLRALIFGAAFSAPPLLVSRALTSGETAATTLFVTLAAVNTLCIVGAVLVGTAIGTRVADVPDPPLGRTRRAGFWIVVLALLSVNGAYFGSAFRAALGVSPVLKCEWSLVPDTFDFELPSLLDPALHLRFDVRIHNPTDRAVRIGDNTIEVRHRAQPVAESRLPPLSVPAGGTARQSIAVRLDGRSGLLDKAGMALYEGMNDGWWDAIRSNANSVADKSAWRVVMTLPVTTGVLVVPLFDGASPGGQPPP